MGQATARDPSGGGDHAGTSQTGAKAPPSRWSLARPARVLDGNRSEQPSSTEIIGAAPTPARDPAASRRASRSAAALTSFLEGTGDGPRRARVPDAVGPQ